MSLKKKPPKRILALPDLQPAKAAVLNSLTSTSGQRTYDHAITEFVAWYCSEPAWSPTAPYCSVSGSMSNSDTMRRPRSTCG
jgi:hypothetical protein